MRDARAISALTRILAVSSLCLALAACGSSSAPSAGDPGTDWARTYIDPRSDLVLAVNLDSGSEAFAQLGRFYPRLKPVIANEFGLAPARFDDAAELGSRLAGLDYEQDVRPLLAGPLVIGVRFGLDGTADRTLVYRCRDPEIVAALLNKHLTAGAVVDGDAVVVRSRGDAATWLGQRRGQAPADIMPPASTSLVSVRATDRGVEHAVAPAVGLLSAAGGSRMELLDATFDLGEDSALIHARASYSSDIGAVPGSAPRQIELRELFSAFAAAGTAAESALMLFPSARLEFKTSEGDLIIDGEIAYGTVKSTGSLLDLLR